MSERKREQRRIQVDYGGITMSRTELNAKIKELRELRRMADELATEIETITDAVKQEMQV